MHTAGRSAAVDALSRVDNTAREWYAHEAFAETWSVRTLKRNIDSQYYFRLLQSQNQHNETNARQYLS
ncbi:MAG: hypothetical protein IJ789_03510 [Bacteroidales bacterium]|nr:hypothetical protein [Bacteroidales bacterium]